MIKIFLKKLLSFTLLSFCITSVKSFRWNCYYYLPHFHLYQSSLCLMTTIYYLCVPNQNDFRRLCFALTLKNNFVRQSGVSIYRCFFAMHSNLVSKYVSLWQNRWIGSLHHRVLYRAPVVYSFPIMTNWNQTIQMYDTR